MAEVTQKKGARRLGFVLLLAPILGLALLAVLLAGGLAIPGLRSKVLDRVIQMAQPHLPGDLVIRKLSWPRPGRLEVERITWIHEQDTLAALGPLALELDLGALLQRDLLVREARLEGLQADLPAIRRVLPPGEEVDSVRAESTGWLRAGSLPGLPSLAVLQLRLQGGPLRLDSLRVLEGLLLRGEFSALADTAPRLLLDSLAVREEASGLAAEGSAFRLDPAAGFFGGRIAVDAGETGALQLLAETPARDRWQVALDLRRGDWNRRLALGGSLTWSDETRLEALSLDSRITLPTAAELRQLGIDASALPAWPELSLGLQGLYRPSPAFLRLDLEQEPNEWDLSLRAGLRHEAGETQLQELRLELDGLELRAEGTLDAERLDGDLSLLCPDLRWARKLELPLPEELDLRLALNATANGSRKHPGLRLRAEAHAALGDSRLDSLSLQIDREGRQNAPWDLALSADAYGQRLRLRSGIQTGATTRITLSDFRLDELREPGGKAAGGGRITLTESGELRIENVSLGGNWLALTLDGRLKGPSGQAAIGFSLDRLPDLLRHTLGAGARDSLLQADWRKGTPLTLSAEATWSAGSPPWNTKARGRLHLPGPARLRALLPPGAKVDDLGDLDLDLALAPTGLRLSARPSDWLQELELALRPPRGGGIRLDSLRLGLPGLALRVSGELPGDSLALDTRLVFRDASFASRFHPALADLAPDLLLEAVLQGPAKAPAARTLLSGSLAYGDWKIDTLGLQTSRSDSLLQAALRLDRGLAGPGLALDSLTLDWSGPANASSGRALLELSGGGWRHSQDLQALFADSLVLEWRELAVSGPGGALRNRAPFRVIQNPSATLRLSPVELEGSLGSLRLQGARKAEGPEIDLHARLAPFRLLADFAVPEALRPDSLLLDLSLAGDSLYYSDMVLRGMRLDSERRLDLSFSLRGGLQRPVLHAHAQSKGDTLLTSRAALPFSISAREGRIRRHPERLELGMVARAFPLPLGDLAPKAFQRGEQGRLSGRLQLDGRAERLDLRTDLALSFAGSTRLEGWRVTLKGEVPASATSAALLAEATVWHHRESILKGKGILGFLRENGGAWRPDSMHADLRADSLDFRRLNDWLPADLWLDGKGHVGLRAQGKALNPVLAGQVRLKELKIGQASGTRLYTSADLHLEGRLSRPEVSGWISLDNGVVAIPDMPRSLLPIEGQARLWELDTPDSELVKGAPSPGIADSLQLDVQLRVPRPIRFEGRDLKLAASGELDIAGEGGMPRLSGELEASEGRFHIMGREVELRRGDIGFYGEGVLDPALDLELGTQINDTEVRVGLSGSFQQPVLDLSSEPELAEGEILALLLFGRPGQELDMDQQDLLQQRATDMATEYGMAQLGARVAREFGVDLLRINREGAGGGSSLELGKYLGPRVFLRYEQALDRQDIFRLRLDYVLSRNLRLESTLGRQSQSGMALSWKWKK